MKIIMIDFLMYIFQMSGVFNQTPRSLSILELLYNTITTINIPCLIIVKLA